MPLFRSPCITEWLGSHGSCPECRTAFTSETMTAIRRREQNCLDELKVVCCYDRSHVVALGKLIDHEMSQCSARPIVCPSSGCGLQLPACELPAHLEECTWAVKECPEGCGQVP